MLQPRSLPLLYMYVCVILDELSPNNNSPVKWRWKQRWLLLKKKLITCAETTSSSHLLCDKYKEITYQPKTSVTLSPLQTHKSVRSEHRIGFTLHYISANVHVGSNMEHIPQDNHTLCQRNWGLRKLPSGLVGALVDADDVALWNTWATVSRAHINKATLVQTG